MSNIKKIEKQGRKLVLAMALGDGNINSRGYLQIRHCLKQREYLEWKQQLLRQAGINTTDVYDVNNHGYGGVELRTYCHDFVKVYRKLLYKPHKIIAQRNVLNKLDPLGIAIWYMDDGGLTIRRKNGKICSFQIMINTCVSKEENDVIIQYFKERWDINFYSCKNRGRYSLVCGTREGRKFLKIVTPFVQQVPCMLYKINIK